MTELSLHEQSDQEVIKRCCTGQNDASGAFRVLYERYSREVFVFLRTFLGDEDLAEDALQDAFVRLYRSLGSYDDARPLKPYIMRMAHNAAIDLIRRRKGEKAGILGELVGPDQTAEEATRRETEERVEKALDKLASEDRSILLLRYVQELKLREISEILSCTERTVRTRLRAAAIHLERELKQGGIVPTEVNS